MNESTHEHWCLLDEERFRILVLTPRSIFLDATKYNEHGHETPCTVTVRHLGTRDSYLHAWSIARRLVASNRHCPALINAGEVAGITVETTGSPCYIYTFSPWRVTTGRTEIDHVHGPATPPIPQRYTGPPLALPWRAVA